MTETLDLSAVRDFATKLDARLCQCDNGEGMICSTMEDTIDHYSLACADLRQFINNWARGVFRKEIVFDPESEKVLKAKVESVLRQARRVAARGRAIDGECYMLEGLNELHAHIAVFLDLLDNWVSPKPAVSPAPRVRIPDALARKMARRLERLPVRPATPSSCLPAEPPK